MFFINFLFEISARFMLALYYFAHNEQFWAGTATTPNFLIFEFSLFVVRFGIFIYLCFVFSSLEKFLIRLNKSDEFDGENFDNVSQTKSEKDREEKRRKLVIKGIQEREKKKKKEEDKANEEIKRQMVKFKDCNLMKNPDAKKKIHLVPEGNLPSNNSFL